jgi:arabinofuranosyltransferase
MNRTRWAAAAAVAIFALAVWRTAWLSDDAYITLRTLDNWVHGYGLRWNIDERVQVYTHPLWMLLLAPFYAITREPLYTTAFLNIVLSVFSLTLLLFSWARPTAQRFWIVALLVFSKTFLSYSTSGLENPLQHLLIAAFCVVWFREGEARARFRWLALIAGLGVMNRMDALLLFAPAIAVETRALGWRRALGPLVAGFAPFLAWEAFALVYYGSPFPNTAYAKLNTGISAYTLFIAALHYYAHLFKWDSLSGLVIAIGLASPILRRDWRALPIAGGAFLYLLYILKIGGDFMSGRFFAAPFWIAIILLYRIEPDFAHARRRLIAFALAPLPLVGLLSLAPGSHFSWMWGRRAHYHEHGVADERLFYYPTTGLLADRPPLERSYLPSFGMRFRQKNQRVVVENCIGQVGYYAGPTVHIIDNFALADPLLARLPVSDPGARIGHFLRAVPPGYQETIATGRNQLRSPSLAAFYSELSLIVRGDLFAPDRLRAIIWLDTGALDHWLRDYVAGH